MAEMSNEAYFSQTRLPSGLFCPVLGLAHEMPGDEQAFDVGAPETPDPIDSVAQRMQDVLGQPLTTAILRKHDNFEPRIGLDDLFHPRLEPDQFEGRIALLSLGGFSYLFRLLSDQGILSTELHAGTAVGMSAETPHWLTPPVAGRRLSTLVLGQDVTKTDQA